MKRSRATPRWQRSRPWCRIQACARNGPRRRGCAEGVFAAEICARSCSAIHPKIAKSSSRTRPPVSSQDAEDLDAAALEFKHSLDVAHHRAVEPIERPPGKQVECARVRAHRASSDRTAGAPSRHGARLRLVGVVLGGRDEDRRLTPRVTRAPSQRIAQLDDARPASLSWPRADALPPPRRSFELRATAQVRGLRSDARRVGQLERDRCGFGGAGPAARVPSGREHQSTRPCRMKKWLLQPVFRQTEGISVGTSASTRSRQRGESSGKRFSAIRARQRQGQAKVTCHKCPFSPTA